MIKYFLLIAVLLIAIPLSLLHSQIDNMTQEETEEKSTGDGLFS